jgi:hypothetical protein
LPYKLKTQPFSILSHEAKLTNYLLFMQVISCLESESEYSLFNVCVS